MSITTTARCSGCGFTCGKDEVVMYFDFRKLNGTYYRKSLCKECLGAQRIKKKQAIKDAKIAQFEDWEEENPGYETDAVTFNNVTILDLDWLSPEERVSRFLRANAAYYHAYIATMRKKDPKGLRIDDLDEYARAVVALSQFQSSRNYVENVCWCACGCGNVVMATGGSYSVKRINAGRAFVVPHDATLSGFLIAGINLGSKLCLKAIHHFEMSGHVRDSNLLANIINDPDDQLPRFLLEIMGPDSVKDFIRSIHQDRAPVISAIT